MSDDISARLGIVHRAGCMAPTTISAMPLATMMGRNPYIVAVADGTGGERFACRLCGRVQGQRPEDDPAPAPPSRGADEAAPPGGPMTDRAREDLARLPAVLAELKGHRLTKTSVATRLGVDPNTLRAWIAKGWMTWPPSD